MDAFIVDQGSLFIILFWHKGFRLQAISLAIGSNLEDCVEGAMHILAGCALPVGCYDRCSMWIKRLRNGRSHSVADDPVMDWLSVAFDPSFRFAGTRAFISGY